MPHTPDSKKDAPVTIFTDGASRGNPGPGGWAAVVIHGDAIQELGGGAAHTTNNAMELTAAVRGLEKTRKGDNAVVYTDSSYLINGITKWVHAWKRNGWLTKTKDEVLNRDLWEELHDLAATRTVKWEYVGGHVGILGNERCDHIATAFADGRGIKLHKCRLADYDLPNILDISHDELKASVKKSGSSRSRAAAFSYVSLVNGIVATHKTWAECEKRVKGARGARYKKALSPEDEAAIMAEFKPEPNLE